MQVCCGVRRKVLEYDEVLGEELGLDAERLEALREAGAIG